MHSEEMTIVTVSGDSRANEPNALSKILRAEQADPCASRDTGSFKTTQITTRAITRVHRCGNSVISRNVSLRISLSSFVPFLLNRCPNLITI